MLPILHAFDGARNTCHHPPQNHRRFVEGTTRNLSFGTALVAVIALILAGCEEAPASLASSLSGSPTEFLQWQEAADGSLERVDELTKNGANLAITFTEDRFLFAWTYEDYPSLDTVVSGDYELLSDSRIFFESDISGSAVWRIIRWMLRG